MMALVWQSWAYYSLKQWFLQGKKARRLRIPDKTTDPETP
jgi:hypothetical protein